MDRSVESEWLDTLPPLDPRASRSRRDLRRLNRCMGNVSIVASALKYATTNQAVQLITELGAGDGDFLLKTARALGQSSRGTRATLLDRQPVVSRETLAAFETIGWKPSVVTQDVFDWCKDSQRHNQTVVVTNLFLHHFETPALEILLKGIESRSALFVALEPQRSGFSLLFSKLVGFIGCNAVTRHDAPASVRAGFAGSELSELWPNQESWTVRERKAGAFGHLFVAKRKRAPFVP